MSCTWQGVKTKHLVARTFFSVLSVSRTFDLHTHMRVAQGVVLSLCTPQKSSTPSIFHRPLLDVPDPFPSFCSTPPPSASTALPMTGIRRPHAPLCQKDCSLAIWLNQLLSHSHHFCPHLFRSPHQMRWAPHLNWILQLVWTPSQLRKEVSSLAKWPNRALLQVRSPSLPLKSVVSTRRSISFREEQVRHELEQPGDYSGCVWKNRHRLGTVDFTSVYSRKRGKC